MRTPREALDTLINDHSPAQNHRQKCPMGNHVHSHLLVAEAEPTENQPSLLLRRWLSLGSLPGMAWEPAGYAVPRIED